MAGKMTYKDNASLGLRHPVRLTPSDVGWLQLVGSLKPQVSFAKEPYQRDDILQKRRTNLRSLLIVATPYLFSYHVHTGTFHFVLYTNTSDHIMYADTFNSIKYTSTSDHIIYSDKSDHI